MAVITRSAAAFSWIDPQTGLPEVDSGGHPGATTTRGTILGEIVYRFCNFLEVRIETDDETGRITSADFAGASGMYRSPSFLRIPSAPVGHTGRFCQITETSATFRQIVGCRTISPEAVGTGVGGIAGLGGGLAVGVFVIGTGGWGLVALGVGGLILGGGVGKETAEWASAFPPIWSEIEITVNSDGTTDQQLIAHSLFPSCTFYRQDLSAGASNYREVTNYNAVPALERWKQHGWNDAASPRLGPTSGNPWNMIHGKDKPCGHTVNRMCPTGYSCS